MLYVWGREEVHAGFWWGNLRGRDHLGGPGVDNRVILKWIFRKRGLGGRGVTDWIILSQNMDGWCVVVNVVLWVVCCC